MASKIPFRSLGRSLNFSTGRANALCHEMLEPHGLSLPQWVILSCLWRDGSLTLGELSDLIGTGLPATSRLIDRMTERGLVTRSRDAKDKRIARIVVTEAGQALDHLADFAERVNAQLLKGFSDAEREKIYDLLSRIEGNARKVLSELKEEAR